MLLISDHPCFAQNTKQQRWKRNQERKAKQLKLLTGASQPSPPPPPAEGRRNDKKQKTGKGAACGEHTTPATNPGLEAVEKSHLEMEERERHLAEDAVERARIGGCLSHQKIKRGT